MLSKKPLSFVVALLVLLSGVLVAMTQTSRSRDQSRPDSLAVQLRVKGESALSQEDARVAPPDSVEEIQRNYQQLQRDLAYLDIHLKKNDLDGFVKAADELEQNWSQEGGEYYGRLMLNISNLIANYFKDERNYPLSQKYIFAALAQADSFSLYLESELLPFIERDLAPKSTTGEVNSEWIKEKSAKAKLWLHALQRLERETDTNFDSNDKGTLNVCPPEETRSPCGIAPEGIKDAKLRAQYEAAIAANTEKVRKNNHQLIVQHLRQFFAPHAEQYLIRSYSKPPYNLEELRTYLNDHLTDKSVKERIISEVKKKITN